MVILLFTLTACREGKKMFTMRQLSEYMGEVKRQEPYVQDVKGVKLSKKNFDYTLSYLPSEAFTLLQNQGASDSILRVQMVTNSHFLYFVLQVGNNTENMMDYLKKQYGSAGGDTLIKQINFQLQPLFQLHYRDQSIPCTFYLQEQAGNLQPFLKIYLVFQNPGNQPPDDDITLDFNDRFLSRQKIAFHLSGSKLRQLPGIQIESKS